MSKKNSRVKELISAHGWIGVITSTVLFLIFWAGAISLFKTEIQQWAELPHHPVDRQAKNLPLSKVVQQTLSSYPKADLSNLFVRIDTEEDAYYRFSFSLKSVKEDSKPERIFINVNPKTGEIVGEAKRFRMANFIYLLHRNLNLSLPGLYIIGIFTLFLFFALLSGVYIHAKKLIRNFFAYRTGKIRTQLLDMHNVVGVMSLPFTLMYAFTGLILNLSVIYQISFVVLLYQGDQDAMIKDAGFERYTAGELAGVAQDMSSADTYIQQAKNSIGHVGFVRFHNYGDTTAAVEIRGHTYDKFAQNFLITHRLSNGEILEQTGIKTNNTFVRGYSVIDALHYGDFAKIDMRMLYFLLAMAVCALIVVGNILWVNKRALQKGTSARVTHFVSNMTIGTCAGFIVATAVAFLAERVLPIDTLNRYSLIVYLFWAIFGLTTLIAFFASNKKRFIGYSLLAMSSALVTTVMASWFLFSNEIIRLWTSGTPDVVAVEIALIITSIIGVIIGLRLSPPRLAKIEAAKPLPSS